MKIHQIVAINLVVSLCGEALRSESEIQGLGRSGRKSVPKTEFESELISHDDKQSKETVCSKVPSCEPAYQLKFPNYDGECNNRVEPNRGKSDRPFKRLLPAEYNDRAHGIRRSDFGVLLPNARIVSNTMSGINRKSATVSHMVPFWGQFLVHDIALTKVHDEKEVDCDCTTPDNECANIAIDKSDEQYQSYPRKTCFELRRSFPVTDSENCERSVRQQLNELSGFMDLAVLYGNTKEHSNAIRAKNNSEKIGELIERQEKNLEYTILPQTDFPGIKTAGDAMFCPPLVRKPPNQIPCFVSGDARTNENSVLLSQHTMWMRFHNSIVRALREKNPHWDSDTLFLTARSIVTALHQQVTFKHFLPSILGPDVMKRFGLNLLENGHWFGYDSSYDATISNSFATAAFRMGHALISNEFTRPNPHWTGSQGKTVTVADSLFDLKSIARGFRTGGTSSYIRGLVNDSALQFDSSFSNSLRNFLDAMPRTTGDDQPGPYGSDLLATNIQRGRDHGLPSYLKYREFCGLKTPRNFRGLSDISLSNQNKLKTLYGKVDNIDLYTGGIAETPLHGAIIGPTFACIIGYQFRDLKRGDRFYHENGGAVQVHTKEQLAAIRSASFAGILCASNPDMESIQPNPMMQVSSDNQRRPCDTYEPLNLFLWMEKKSGWLFGHGKPIVKQDYEWTSWFPTTYQHSTYSNADVLNLLFVRRPSEVCTQVMMTETKMVNGNKLIRFQCLPGTIKHTDFPVVPSEKYYWTSWINDHKGEAEIEIETSKSGVCRFPYAFQAQTLDRTPAGETGDVFTDFGANFGLLCEGKNQPSGKCNDYRVRYLCRRTTR